MQAHQTGATRPRFGGGEAPEATTRSEDQDDDPCGWKSICDNTKVGRRVPACGYWRQNAGLVEVVLPFEPTARWDEGPKPRAVLNAARTVLTVRLPRDPAKGQVTSREKYDPVKLQTHIVFPCAVRTIEAESVHHIPASKETSGSSVLCVLLLKCNGSNLVMWPSLSAHAF